MMHRVLNAVLWGAVWTVWLSGRAAAGTHVGGVPDKWPPMLLAHSGNPEEVGGSGATHFLRWIGHFHPPITAFPIAMLVGAALAELLRIVTKAAWLEGAGRWCVMLGAASAVVAAPLGWAFAVGRSGTWLLQTHRWLGTILAVLSVVVLVLSERRFRANLAEAQNPTGFRVALFVAAALVMATGFFGGAMVYGLHAYLWTQPEHAQADVEPPPHSTGSSASSQPATGEVVTINLTDEFRFKPGAVRVPVGTTVRWVNNSGDTHTVSNDPKSASDAKNVSTPAGAATFNSGEIKPGGTFEHRFTVPGEYHYVCEPHEEMGMTGTVVVTP
jgi:plastocyanin